MSETITAFKMGDAIPEWLLALNPGVPGAVKGAFRFGTDVDVIEAESYYLIFPTSVSPGLPTIIDLEGSYGCNVWAAAKPVFMVHGRSITFPEGTDLAAWCAAHGWTAAPTFGPEGVPLPARTQQELGAAMIAQQQAEQARQAELGRQEALRQLDRIRAERGIVMPGPKRSLWRKLSGLFDGS